MDIRKYETAVELIERMDNSEEKESMLNNARFRLAQAKLTEDDDSQSAVELLRKVKLTGLSQSLETFAFKRRRSHEKDLPPIPKIRRARSDIH